MKVYTLTMAERYPEFSEYTFDTLSAFMTLEDAVKHMRMLVAVKFPVCKGDKGTLEYNDGEKMRWEFGSNSFRLNKFNGAYVYELQIKAIEVEG